MSRFKERIARVWNLLTPGKGLFLTVGVLGLVGGASLWGYWKSQGTEAPSSSTSTNEKTLHVHDESTESKLYTCPMHSHIIQDQPGTCPICGMDLVIKIQQATEEKAKEKVEEKADQKADSVETKKPGERKVKHWVAPMDPTYISEKPGKSPMGMDLVPVYEDDGKNSGPEIRVDPVVVQNMGVRVAHVQRGVVIRNVRTIGEVEVAEDQVSVVNLRFSGWIEKIWADQTQQKVKKGDRLFQIYSPELVAAQEEYLLSFESGGRSGGLAKASEKRLKLWEIPKSHIERLAKTRNGQARLIVRAPRGGYILHKDVVLGNKVNAGKDLYRIGNLSKIWVTAEVYEHDAPWIEVGQKAQMSLSFQEGKQFHGKVAYVYPTLNKGSRTLSVRLEFANPGLNLKPGMFATVHIEAQRREGVVTVPTESIIHSGERKIVFTSSKLGRYRAIEVTTGLVGGNRRTEILTGLSPGDVVVVSGQFLLDSESQLQEAVQKMIRDKLQSKKAAAGGSKSSRSESKKGASATDHSGHDHLSGSSQSDAATYYTCSMHPQVVLEEPGTCPICSMNLVKRKAE